MIDRFKDLEDPAMGSNNVAFAGLQAAVTPSDTPRIMRPRTQL